MGWLSGFLQRIGGAAPVEMTLIAFPKAALPGFGEEILADECYVELYVESLRLKNARRFATKFNGLVYSFVELARTGEANAEFAAASKPQKLTELDSNSLDKVITVSKQMLAPVPWRGGTLKLQIGLFSVRSGNVLTPILNYVTKVSSTAGVSFVEMVKPFVPLITEGMDLIAGQTDDTALEVAIDTDIALRISGVYAIIALAKNAVDAGKLTIDGDHKLLLDGVPLQAAYCVFSIKRATAKPDFGEIPELKIKYGAVQSAIRAGKLNDAKEALTAFKLATIASPDLIPADARRLVQKVDAMVREAFEGGPNARGLSELTVPELSQVALYN